MLVRFPLPFLQSVLLCLSGLVHVIICLNDFSIEVDEKEESGFLAGLKIPAPWATGKSVESSHPLRDNYKFKETVHIPGARCLYLRFDPRCSSQYDYDKVGCRTCQFLTH